MIEAMAQMKTAAAMSATQLLINTARALTPGHDPQNYDRDIVAELADMVVAEVICRVVEPGCEAKSIATHAANVALSIRQFREFQQRGMN